ncbi:hypothetical protein BDZ90DRAFT_282425 [Jaminaea rosea]|uniref:Protein kinase domain-containing protein n=1 Tax=Jaminaea rosea TaxID=1569628 RepID=A0A316UGX6_9BASI|nr:hypothetical protein BDZ90DRAFT_282425 [Jaminaea rosea]PWN24496.1 hypothetical protein BDZ90DRAFT_282425 [Jaminaea rosea]
MFSPSSRPDDIQEEQEDQRQESDGGGGASSPPRHPPRPGPSVLTGVSSPQRQQSGGNTSSRTPAAGAGTRTGPRPVPRSSSSLRHISSSRSTSSRGVSFKSVPEDRAADANAHAVPNDLGSSAKRKMDAEERKRREMLQQEDFWADDDSDVEARAAQASMGPSSSVAGQRAPLTPTSDEEEDGDELDAILPPHRRSARRRLSRRRPRGSSSSLERLDANVLAESTTEDEDDEEAIQEQGEYSSQTDDDWSEAEEERRGSAHEDGDEGEGEGEDEGARHARNARYAARDPGGPSLNGPRRAPWHQRGPAAGYSAAMQTPGLAYPPALETPMEGSPGTEEVEADPRQRLEWQTMLESVLASEVLRSETKRITSVDAPDVSKRELMYRRWLDIRASLRGRGHLRGAVDAEEKRLKRGWPELLRSVIEAIKNCRSDEEQQQRVGADEPLVQGQDHAESQDEKQRVLEEVGNLLQRVDESESQFPSLAKAIEVVPEWGDKAVQGKLEALYAWYNTATLLELRLRILKEWTGSETLRIDVPLKSSARDQADPNALIAAANGELEGMTFVERVLKEGSLQHTFEKRTLGSLNQLVCKARDTIKTHHESFLRMKLPSFAPELVQLISFPMRLVEGALRLRLDYAGKIKEPSLLIVDSLTDDLRAVLDVAIRTKRTYLSTMVPDPSRGWDMPPVIDASYDEILRDALRFFFRFISFKLKGSVFFKETEILDNEWQFLSQAVEVIEGGDVIVAKSITRIVNKLFARIVTYFERELSAPSATKGRGKAAATAQGEGAGTNAAAGGGDGVALSGRGPSLAGGLTKGTVHLTLPEKIKWIHAVFDNVRIRSRKLLGFARDIRNRLDNAAEYDLATLRPPDANGEASGDQGDATMDLNAFMQTLINADYFLVYTEVYEERGIYIVAEPTLHDKPEIIEDLLRKCVRKIAPHSNSRPSGGAGGALAEDEERGAGTTTVAVEETEAASTVKPTTPAAAGSAASEEESSHYLLLLTPRDPFMWTGRVMPYKIEYVEVSLNDRRLRLIADGPKERLQLCKERFQNEFKRGGDSSATVFPLDVINEHMAHMSDVQAELRNINKGVYMLSNTVLNAVSGVQRNLRRRHRRNESSESDPQGRRSKSATESEELIQNCFSMAAEQGFRSLPFIESNRLRGYMTLALARLAINWVGFICDDCVHTDRKTFKWAVAALENAVQVTRNENIFHLSEDDFAMMRAKVASCVALLISHFDILGARSSVANAKAEQERLEREKAERSKAMEAGNNLLPESADAAERHAAASRLIQGADQQQPQLQRMDSGTEAMEERWVQKMIEWDEARQSIEAEQRLIGRVLDDTRLEDRGLQFLASSSSRIQIRWQQGRFIGGGTFGTVYLAVNLDSGGLMAVKEIRFQDISNTPTLYKQIKDEMNVMEMLSHPNIVEYYGIEVHRDKVYIFEEYCQGGSLAQLLEHGRIEDEAVIQVYTLQMLDGLVYLHSQGVVHRDIKPDNILLDHMGVIKFVDFGAAKVLAKNSRTVQRSRRSGITPGNNMAGMVGPDGKPVGAAAVQSLQGTPMYMSPEVIKGESRGRRGAMDVWSLGCVVLEFATGRRPWSQLDNEWAIMFHIGMAQQHPPLPEPGQLSEMGIDFIRQCLIIDPYDRPSAAEMRQHPWIRNLVEQLDAAAADEEAAAATAAAMGGENNSYAGADTSSLQYDAATPFQHTSDSATGIAAMVATPGTRSINGFNFQRPGMPSAVSSATSASGSASASETLTTPPSQHVGAGLPHQPSHSGFPATVADMAWKREERLMHEMKKPLEMTTGLRNDAEEEAEGAQERREGDV